MEIDIHRYRDRDINIGLEMEMQINTYQVVMVRGRKVHNDFF